MLVNGYSDGGGAYLFHQGATGVPMYDVLRNE